MQDYDEFYIVGQPDLMYNQTSCNRPSVSRRRTAPATAAPVFGNACLVAKQVLAANQGTRFVQITFGSWDMHQDIYGAAESEGQ